MQLGLPSWVMWAAGVLLAIGAPVIWITGHHERKAAAPRRPMPWPVPTMPRAYLRLGDLYEGRGEREKASEYDGRFVDLWKDADAELQPRVREVRVHIRRIVGEG